MHPDDGEPWTLERATKAIEQYRRFLFLSKHYPQQRIVPSWEVDQVWHAHILDTTKYREDCDRLFGSFMDHWPYFGMKDEAELDACLANADIRREIADVVGLGEQNGVSSTPSIFVNGRQLGRSEEWYTPTGLSAILDAELGVEPAAAPAEDAASESGDAPAEEETEAEAPADTEAE